MTLIPSSTEEVLPYILMLVGIVGFELAGRRVWWAWYVNIANQGLWLLFALITGYWGFVVGTLFYTYQFTRNAIKWTKDRHILKAPPEEYTPFGTIESASLEYGKGITVYVQSHGVHQDNVPRMGTPAYFKRGELPEYDRNEYWMQRPT